MLKDTSSTTCAACGDGVPVGTIPTGQLAGRPGCDACLRAITEAEGPAHLLVRVERDPGCSDDAPALRLTADAPALRALLDELPEGVDCTEPQGDGTYPRARADVWGTRADTRPWRPLVAAVRRAAQRAEVDLRLGAGLARAGDRAAVAPAAARGGGSR